MIAIQPFSGAKIPRTKQSVYDCCIAVKNSNIHIVALKAAQHKILIIFAQYYGAPDILLCNNHQK